MSPPRERPAGFSQVYRQHFGFVWRLAYRLGVDARDLEDVAQDVFIVVHRQLPEFEQRCRIETWLAAITRRVAWRHRRSRERAHRKLDAIGLVEPLDDGFSFDRSAAIRSLDRFLQDLPREQREVFVLSELEGLQGPEIVDVTGMKLNTVYARIRTTRQRFDSWCAMRRVADAERAAEIPWRSRRELRPPRDAAPRVWALLAIRLAGPATATGKTSFATSVGVYAVTLAIGGVGLAALAAVLPPRASSPSHEALAPQPAVRATEAPSRPPAKVEAPVVVTSTPATASVASPPSRRPATSAGAGPAKPPPPASASPGEEALARERSLIASSRAAVDRDPEGALALLDAHEREFPSGVLRRERTRLRVRSLCRAQRMDEARAEAEAAGDRSLLARECSTR